MPWHELRITSGQYAGRTWKYDDEDDARTDAATLGPDADWTIVLRQWFGGAWMTTVVAENE